MPIAFDPNETVTFSLESDAALPEHERPRFTTRFLTAREHARCARLRAEYYRDNDELAALEKLVEAAGLGLVSWDNLRGADGLPATCGKTDLGDVLTPLELDELYFAKCKAVTLSELDRKKSALPSRSVTSPTAETSTESPVGSAAVTACGSTAAP